MKKIDVYSAVGLPLCHDITAMKDGFKGALFKRGHIIEEKDIPVLLDLGKKTVYVWEDDNLIHEDDAAREIADMLKTENTIFTDVSEGKIVMLADCDGMVKVDTELIRKINSVGDITVTTLPNHYPVKKGAKLASMRIVPLATDKAKIEKAKQLCSGKKAVQLLPYKQLKAGVIITGSEFYTGRIKDRFEDIARDKLAKYPCSVMGVEICDDDVDMICRAAEKFINQKADLIV
ncbi:MAG: hypothetical protein IKT63_00255, partial [Oscillospiraceae bacterium]|nr:hypothetical protein [Oscillospiraceae bacterium]